MDWLDVVTKVVLPLSTFGLGVAVTLITKVWERQRNERRASLEQAADLLNQWYNQIYEIAIPARYSSNEEDIFKRVEFYLGNRLILPKLLKVRTEIEHQGNFQALKIIQNFLGVVTNVDLSSAGITASRLREIILPHNKIEAKMGPFLHAKCHLCLETTMLDVGRDQNSGVEHSEGALVSVNVLDEQVLKQLDIYVQKMSILAGMVDRR